MTIFEHYLHSGLNEISLPIDAHIFAVDDMFLVYTAEPDKNLYVIQIGVYTKYDMVPVNMKTFICKSKNNNGENVYVFRGN